MRIRAAVVAASLLATTSASADGKHTLVLKSDGNADSKVRAQVDAAVLKFVKGSAEGVAPGDISFADAAIAVGCSKPDAPSCKDDVIGMLSVDEIIATTVTRKPGGLEVVVRRSPKTGAAREVTAKIADAQDALLAPQLTPLFGATSATPPTPPTPPVAVIETTGKPPPVEPLPPPDPTRPPPTDTTTPPVDTAPRQSDLMQPLPPPIEDQQHTRLQLAGMIGGGACLLLGFVMWGQASGTQSDIDAAPTRTKAQLQHIQDLEKQGDSQAGLGNLLFVGGIVLGSISTYLFIRDRGRRSTAVARISPTVFDHGAGFALTGVLP